VTFLRSAPAAAPKSARGAAAGDGTPKAPVVLVPKSALRSEGAQSIVFVVTGQNVERRAVSVASADGDRLEVVAGLRPGEQVVAPLPPGLVNGARVSIR
jgi:hypothetical protein